MTDSRPATAVAASGSAWRRFAAGLPATAAESRLQIGWVIAGAISFGTLFTMLVVPTAYTPSPAPATPPRTPRRRPRTKLYRSAKLRSDHRRRQKSPNRCGRALCDASGSAASGFLRER